jgi:hypothetical protein
MLCLYTSAEIFNELLVGYIYTSFFNDWPEKVKHKQVPNFILKLLFISVDLSEGQ